VKALYGEGVATHTGPEGTVKLAAGWVA
jgi:hypothetical protein